MVGALLAVLLVAMLPSTSFAVPIVPFAARFSADDNGTVTVFGNNLLTCPTSDARCAGAQAGTTALNNNAFSMANLDADADPSTFNSSSSTVIAPADGEVLWAGLYWGARASRGAGGVAGVGDRRVMALRAPGASTYTSVTSQASFGPTSGDQAYQEFADVTTLVRSAGAGAYWGANVVAGTGEDRYAGWSLVVVFRAPSLPLRSLTVFDGFADVGRDEPQVINLSGFRTPVSGPVETQLGMVAYEGDFSTSGDSARLNSTLLSTTPLSRGSNFFNGTNDDNGTSVASRTPAHVNMLGYDVKNLAASGIPNGATSATISLESTGDRYFPGMVTTAIRLFAPDFTTSTKTVSNLAGRTPALPGDELEYTLTYPNTGQDPATNAVITDTLPPGTTFVSATPSAGACTGSGRTVTCTAGTIGIGATWQARVRVAIGPDAGGTTLRNAAVLDYTATTLDRDLTYVVAPAVIPVAAVADLALTKTMSPDPGVAGGQVVSTLSVRNDGPNAAREVVITDQLPAGVTLASATVPGGACTTAGAVVTCTVPSIANGASVDATIVIDVPSSSTALTVVNVASVSAASSDPDASDNAAGASVALTRQADLRVSKAAGAASIAPGASTTYTVTVTNDGPSDAVNVTATDAVGDPALVLTRASAPGAACAVSAETARCTIPRLAPGATMSMTVTARVLPDTPAGVALVNTATVSSNAPDADASDNTATATITTAAPLADITTTKSSSDARAGGQVVYTIVVTNEGPSTARGVSLADALPAGLTATSVVSSRGTCTTAAAITCDLGDVPGPDAAGVASSATITVTADVAPTLAAGTISNTATASTVTTDPDPANNAATVQAVVTTAADVSITKTASPVQPAAGEDVTFTVTVSNAGPSTARDVVVADALPPGLTLLGVDPGPDVTCTGSLSCTVADLDPQATATFAVRMNVPADFDLQTGAVNTATVTSSTPDPAPGNNTATATVTARAISDLAVLKWDTTDLPSPPGTPPRSFTAGETVTYRIAALNFGPSDASSARVVDTLPAGVTFISSVPECAFTPPDQLVCDLPTVPNQFAAIFPVTVRVDAALAEGALLTNTAEITLTDPDRVDPVSSNNLVSVTNPVTTVADLNVVKSSYSLDLPDFTFTTPSSAPPGTNIGYGIDIRNTGPSIARDVVLVDSSTMTDFYVNRILLVKPGVDPIDITAQCSWSGGDLQCPIGDVPVFATGDTSWRVQVDGLSLSNATPGSYVNTATLSSGTADANIADNTSQAPITITDPVATFTIDKTVLGGTDLNSDGASDIIPGTAFSYQIDVENVVDVTREGASDAPDVVVVDELPEGLTPTAATSTQGTCTITPPRTVTCELGTVLGPGRLPAPPPVLITVSGTAAASLAGTPTVTNTASVSSPISATVTDSVTQDVVAVADLSITKVADAPQFAAGGLAGFSLVVTNAGPSDAVQTEVGDLFPSQIVFDPEASDPSCSEVVDPAVTYVSCMIGTLASGETRTVRVAGRIPPDQAPIDVVNFGAVASAVTGEPNFTDNQSEVTVSIVQSADLVVTKAADAASYAAGERATYTIGVTNQGPSTASDVVMTDALPAGLAFVDVVAGDGVTCEFAAGVVTCTAPTLGPGDAVSATVRVDLPADLEPGPVVNTASVVSSTPDPDVASNSASTTFDAFVIADLAIDKSLVTPAPVAGSPVVFALEVTNKGPQNAPSVVVSDSLPTGMGFLSGQGAACQVTNPEGIDVVTCEAGALAVGATARILLTASTDPSIRSFSNGALVGSAAQDAVSADNFDVVEFALTPPEAPGEGGGSGSAPLPGGELPPTGAPFQGIVILVALGLTALGAFLVLRRRRV